MGEASKSNALDLFANDVVEDGSPVGAIAASAPPRSPLVKSESVPIAATDIRATSHEELDDIPRRPPPPSGADGGVPVVPAAVTIRESGDEEIELVSMPATGTSAVRPSVVSGVEKVKGGGRVAAAPQAPRTPPANSVASAVRQPTTAPKLETKIASDGDAPSGEGPDVNDLAAGIGDYVVKRLRPSGGLGGSLVGVGFHFGGRDGAVAGVGAIVAVVGIALGWFGGAATMRAQLDMDYARRLGSVSYLQKIAVTPVGRRWLDMLGRNSAYTIQGIMDCAPEYGLHTVEQSQVPGCAGGGPSVSKAWRVSP